jgi:hypothetical protein
MTQFELALLQTMDAAVFMKETCGLVPDPWQKQVLRYEGKRLIMNCCRQSGKSQTTAVLAYHRAKHTPKSLILLLSPSFRQSGELFRKIVELTYADRNPLRKVEDQKLFMKLENGSRIVSLPGTENTIRSYSGVDLIVVDEASRIPDDLYMAIRPMLAVSNGSLVLLSTPHGKRGVFFDEWCGSDKKDPQDWKEIDDEWERVQITADQCPRITKGFLDEEKRSLPERWYLQEYFCRFLETEDQVFAYDLIKKSFTDDVKPFFTGSAKSSEVQEFFS